MYLDCGPYRIDLGRPVVMGIINTTPDSFSDGGRHLDPGAAVDAAHKMVAAGAAIIDVGGESTRPGADSVDVDEERRRVLPVVRRLVDELTVPVSIDTSKPQLMREMAAEGCGMINDVFALRVPGALEAAAETGLPICLMHMLGEPRSMQAAPAYDDVVTEVLGFLAARVAECEAAGIERRRLLIDPGFGFGKTVGHNATLLGKLSAFKALGLPLLAGLSRKSMIAAAGVTTAAGRLAASVALAVLAVERGAQIVRVHDVAPTVDALKMLELLEGPR
jgi:dihydropteroate synthase